MPVKENLTMPDHLLEDNETNQETKKRSSPDFWSKYQHVLKGPSKALDKPHSLQRQASHFGSNIEKHTPCSLKNTDCHLILALRQDSAIFFWS